MPYFYYKTYGDKEFIRKYFSVMERYIESMHGFCEDGLIVREREKGWCLGDWCTPTQITLPESLVNTYYYVLCMQHLQFLGEEIGVKKDYSVQIENSKSALKRTFFDQTTHSFFGGVQGADAFMLNIGLGDEITERNMIEHYERTGHFDTGIFGTDVVCELLVKLDRQDLLYKLLTADGFPSFGYMRQNRASTIWEDWDGRSSHDHPMFGGCVKQIFFGLLGIKGDIGYKNVSVCPPRLPEVKYMEGELSVGGGRIFVKVEYHNGEQRVKVRRYKLNH